MQTKKYLSYTYFHFILQLFKRPSHVEQWKEVLKLLNKKKHDIYKNKMKKGNTILLKEQFQNIH